MRKNNDSWGIVGHEKIVSYLQTLVELSSYAHAYVFSGLQNLGKKAVLEVFINKIISDDRVSIKLEDKNGQRYTDFHYLEPEHGKNNISVLQVRKLINTLSLTSFTDNYKIAVINHAERLNEKSSNALLKLLEEPSSKTILFLLTSDHNNLLETIQSRSVVMQFNTVSAEIISRHIKEISNGLSHRDIESISNLSFGRPGRAITYLRDPEKFAKIKERTSAIITCLNRPLYEKFEFIKGQLAEGDEVVHTLQLVLRDLLSLHNNTHELVVNHFALEELKNLKESISTVELLKALEQLQVYSNAKAYNVNANLFLENILLHV